MPDSQRPQEPLPPERLEAGLKAAFQKRKLAGLASSRDEDSILASIEKRAQSDLRVAVPDAALEREPILQAVEVEMSQGVIERLSSTRYQVLGEIARGGVGVIYKGRDVDLGRDVALKVLHKGLIDRKTVLERFLAEAQIGGQLQHPGVVPVYELGLQADDRPFFAMKLVKGDTLSSLLEKRQDPEEDRHRLLQIFQQVCQTMAYAHARCVVHRDLKPSNIMVGVFGEVQVVDWGFAKVLARGGVNDEKRSAKQETGFNVVETIRSKEGSSHSQAGSVFGTPAYMPPEQARGDVEHMDQRGDVFSLGAVLCEILTGDPPHVGDDGEDLLLVAAEARLQPALGRLRACGADPELVRIATGCLAAAPKARPRDASVLAELVTAYLQSVEERARQAQVEAAEARIKANEARRAHRLTMGLAVSVLLTVLLGGGGWAYLSRQRADRQRLLEERVHAAISEAVLLRGKESWAEALAAAERAKALTESPDATPELRQAVGSLKGELETDLARDRARRERARRNAILLDRLDSIRTAEYAQLYAKADGAVGSAKGSTERQREERGPIAKLKDRLYRETFAELGIDLETDPDQGIVKTLRSTGIQAELSLTLDHWATVRAKLDDGHRTREKRLLRLALAVDDDPWRRKVRTALLEDDRARLARLAEQGEVSGSPVTATVLAQALSHAGRLDASLAVLRAALRRHPGDFGLLRALGVALGTDKGDLEEALRYLTAALAVRPASAIANYSLGVMLLLRGRPDEAIASYRRAIEIDPGLAHAHDHLGYALAEQGKLDEAIASWRWAIEVDPNYANALYNLGVAFSKQGKLDEAIASYRKAIRIDPELVHAHHNLGLELSKQGKLDEAIASYRKAIEIEPNHPRAHSNLGNALVEQGKLDEAIASYVRAIEINSRDADAHNNLSIAYSKQGRLDKAVASCRRAIEIDPTYARAYNNLGIALARQGKLDEAVASYRRAIEIDPRNAGAHDNLGNTLAKLGKLDEAMASCRRAIQIDPNYALARYNLGTALLGQGKLDEAIASYREAIRINPKFALACHNLGQALENKGKLDEAISSYRKAIGVDPKLVLSYHNLGRVLSKQGRLDEAIASYRKAIWIDPKFALAHHNLGCALAKQGKLEEAIASYRKAIRIDPKVAEAHTNLGLALLRQGRLEKALTSLRNARDTLSQRRDALAARTRAVVSSQIERLEPLVSRRDEMSAIVHGKRPAVSSDDWVAAASWAYLTKDFAGSARTYGRAFAMPGDQRDKPGHRYNAACAATLAGCGQGRGGKELSEEQRVALRRQAHAWLQKDLEYWRTQPAKAAVPQLRHRLRDPDLAGIREEKRLRALPTDEADRWRVFWREVRQALTRLGARR